MTTQIIHQRLRTYSPVTIEDEQNALKEILQEIVLYALYSAGFFSEALFHGDTSLRILYNLPRFSEDLDFVLTRTNKKFRWEPYLQAVTNTCEQFGIEPEVIDRSKTDSTVQKMFFKDNSIGKMLNLNFHHNPDKKLLIKLEIDTNPPQGSLSEMKFLDFPVDYSVMTQDLSSNFAGKCHALLCRPYIKARDWFDFTWYITNRISPNLSLLSNAIDQQGPWKNQKIRVTLEWLKKSLHEKVKTIDWQKAANEVMPFLNKPQQASLKIWCADFFVDKLNKL